MAGSKSWTLSAETFKYWVLDHQKAEITFVLQSGRKITLPMSEKYPLRDAELALSVFDWEKWWITSITKRGDPIVTEAFSPVSTDPLRGRPVVYLDQNHWSKVSLAFVAPGQVRSEAERRAALRLIQLANDDGIVLPLSSAHMLETSSLYGDRRYQVGVALASLSAGWQMRNPMAVWSQEASRVLCDLLEVEEPPRASLPVVTLEPNVMFSSEDADPDEADSELFIRVISSPGATLQVLLNPEREERVPIEGWVEHYAGITRQFESVRETKDAKRKTALRRFWNDNLGLFHSVLRQLPTSKHVPSLSDSQLAEALASMPMLSHLSGLFVRRFLDSTTTWTRNDLIDMLFLSCAAGYADYIAAERHTGSQLQQIQRSLDREVTVHTTLHELVKALNRAGVQTATEREARSARTSRSMRPS